MQSGDPFILFEDGTPLTRPRFVEQVHLILCRAGYSPGLYVGHSFRIGAATMAAACGIEDSTIQTLGCWENAAYFAESCSERHLRRIERKSI